MVIIETSGAMEYERHPDKKIVKIKAINTCRDKIQTVILFGILAIENVQAATQ